MSLEDFRDAFCVAGGAFGRPWLRWIRRLTRRTQDFTMEGVHVVGHTQGVWGRKKIYSSSLLFEC